ncbi:MAG TPA: site-2 protease family protein [Elusimicrobiales bacterium]|nr:site-2 protease family protein [Elusimicrobiales bacterium]
MEWILQLPVLFFSVIVHEFAHGYMANRRGDDTAYLSGRLTFNPLPHIDPVGTVLLPLACAFMHIPTIGWAKPVPVNPYRMYHPRADMAAVAVSGPLSNLLLVALSAVAFKLITLWLPPVDLVVTAAKVISYAIMINLALAMFNLIPIYPLDGSQIMLNLLKGRWLELYEKHLPYGMYIIFGLVMTGAIKVLILPPLFLALQFLSYLGVYVGI